MDETFFDQMKSVKKKDLKPNNHNIYMYMNINYVKF